MGTPTFAASNPGQNQFLREYLTNRIDGKAMRALKVERESLIASLKATGQAQPATIMNFNPVPLRLDGGINFKVPSIIDRAVLEADEFTCSYKGRKYRGDSAYHQRADRLPVHQGCEEGGGCRGWHL